MLFNEENIFEILPLLDMQHKIKKVLKKTWCGIDMGIMLDCGIGSVMCKTLNSYRTRWNHLKINIEQYQNYNEAKEKEAFLRTTHFHNLYSYPPFTDVLCEVLNNHPTIVNAPIDGKTAIIVNDDDPFDQCHFVWVELISANEYEFFKESQDLLKEKRLDTKSMREDGMKYLKRLNKRYDRELRETQKRAYGLTSLNKRVAP